MKRGAMTVAILAAFAAVQVSAVTLRSNVRAHDVVRIPTIGNPAEAVNHSASLIGLPPGALPNFEKEYVVSKKRYVTSHSHVVLP